MESESVLPCPLFEGSEKRLAAEFSFGAASPTEGLRALSRGQLDALLRQVCHLSFSCMLFFTLWALLSRPVEANLQRALVLLPRLPS